MEDKIKDYYSKFEDIYNDKNYPKWFKFKNDHNKKFGELGYTCKCRFCPGSRINAELEHELGHYAILQTPLHEDVKIVIVGNNNSWFDESCGDKALKAVKSLKRDIPTRNSYTEGKSGLSKSLIKAFNAAEAAQLLKNNTVGLNRTWLQTGGSSANISKMKEKRLGIPSLVEICHIWTEDIITIIKPQLVLLLGGEAQKLFNNQQGDAHEKGSFYIQHCRHPSNGGQTKFTEDLKDGLKEYEKRKSRFL
jgi:hypothetical protein